jgi:uncharacterized protein YecE (DUF72 family)
MMGNIYIGTSGFSYSAWKGKFYPEDLPQNEWLSFYAKTFETLEINASFYGTIGKAQYTRWHDQTGKDFKFAVKGHRLITQMKKLHEIDDAVKQFIYQTAGLGNKSAVMLWQFPRSFTLKSDGAEEYKHRLRHFLDILPQDVQQAFEFRNASWFTPEVQATLDRRRASFVMSDSPKFPSTDILGKEFVYIRFHGPDALYASHYSHDQLGEWARKIKSFSKDHDVYCYFNNDLSGYAIENAQELRRLLDESGEPAKDGGPVIAGKST